MHQRIKRETQYTVLAAVLLLVVTYVVFAITACYSGPTDNSSVDAGSNGSVSEASGSDENYYSLVEEGKLTVVSSFDCLPIAGKSVDVMNGFGYELLVKVAEKLGLEATWQSVDEGAAADALTRAGSVGQRVVGGNYMRADVALVAVSADEVPDGVAATSAYLETHVCMVAKKSTEFSSLDDLGEGNKVGVMAGSASEAWAHENMAEGVELVAFASTTELYSALQARNVDAVISDVATANYELRVAYGDCEIEQTLDDQVQYCLYVNGENQNLINAINEALEDLDEDGTLAELEASWLSEADNSRGQVETRTPPQGAETHYKGTN